MDKKVRYVSNNYFQLNLNGYLTEFTDFAITDVTLAACDYQYLLRTSNFHIGLNTTTKTLIEFT